MSTQSQRKKATERFYLDRFQELSNLKFVILEDREEPDFLLKLPDGNTVGLEVRMLFKDEAQAGSPKKKQEQERRRFLLRIADAYYRQGGLPACVRAIFPRQFVPNDSWIEKLAKRFRMARPTGSGTDKPLKIDLGNNTICTFFVEALAEAAGKYRQWICASNSVGWVRAITVEDLTEKITEKAKKLPAYLKAAEQIMLLLVAERIQASGMIEYSPGPALLPSQGFSEVHLLINPLKSCRIA